MRKRLPLVWLLAGMHHRALGPRAPSRHAPQRAAAVAVTVVMVLSGLLVWGPMVGLELAGEARGDGDTPEWSYTTGDNVGGVAISADGEYIAAGSADSKVYLFDKDSSTPLRNYTTGDNTAKVAVSADGEYIAAGSYDAKVYLFNKDSSTPLWNYTTGGSVYSVAISADGEYIAAGSADSKVYLFDKGSSTPLWSYTTGGNVLSVAISADGEYIAAGSGDRKVYLFDKDSSTPLWNYTTGNNAAMVAVSANGEYVAVGSQDGKVYLFDKDSSTPLWSYTTGDEVYPVAISADGEYIAAGSGDNKVYLFDKDSSTPLWSYTTGDYAYSVAISADGEYVAAGSQDNKVYLFNRDSSTPLWSYTTGDYVQSVAISADGEYIAAGSNDDKVYLFKNPLPDLTLTLSSPLYYPHDLVDLTASLNQTSPANLTFTVLDPAGSALPQAAATLPTALHQRPLAADANTVGLWRFDDGWGPTAADSSGNGNDGELVNGSQWAEGKLGGALLFDGEDDYVAMNHHNTLNVGGNGNGFTAEAWIKSISSTSTWQQITRKGNSSIRYEFKLTNDRTGLRIICYDGGDNPYVDATISADDGKWHHAAFSKSASDNRLRLYFDGSLKGTSTSECAGTESSTESLYIGSAGVDIGEYFNGTLDEVRISSIARDPSEFNLYQRAAHSFRLGPRAAPGTYTVYANATGGGSAVATFEVGALQATTDREWYYQGEEIAVGAEYYDVNATNVTWVLLDPEGEVVETVADVPTSIDGWEYETDDATVGLWHFDEGYGGTAYDSSGEGNDGTLENGPEWVDGDMGATLEFDGEDDYVAVPHDLSLAPTEELAIEVWFNTHDKNVQQIILSKAESGGYVISINNDGNVQMWIQIDGSYQVPQFSITEINNNEWNHIVGTYNGSAANIYLNGILKDTVTVSGQIEYSWNNSLMIGIEVGQGTEPSSDDYFDGALDEIRISNTSRAPSEFNLFQSAAATLTLPASAAPGVWTLRATAADGSLIATRAFAVRPMLTLEVPAGNYSGGDTLNVSAELFRGGAENLTFVLLDPEGREMRNVSVAGELGGWAYEANDATVGLWHFDEGSGDTAWDASGNGYDGILENGATWTSGKLNGALEFDGSNDYLEIDNGPIIADQFTLSLWMKVDDTTTKQTIISKYSEVSCGSGAEMIWFLIESDSIYWSIRDNDGQGYTVSYPFTDTTQWHHLAETFDGTKMRAYLDGVEVGNVSVSSLCKSSAHYRFGRQPDSDELSFDGIMDEIHISNVARDPLEVNLLQRAAAVLELPAGAQGGNWTVRVSAAGFAAEATVAVNGTAVSVNPIETSDSVLLRTASATLYANLTTPGTADYNASFAYRFGGGDWASDWLGDPEYNATLDAWTALFTPPAAADLGDYDFRVVFRNESTNATLSREAAGFVTVANNPPLATGLAPLAAFLLPGETTTVWAGASDAEDALGTLGASIEYRLNGSGEWLTTALGSPVWVGGRERYEALFAPPALPAVYDLRARFADGDGGLAEWRYANMSVSVSTLRFWTAAPEVLRTASVTLYANLSNGDTAGSAVVFAYRAPGGEWASDWLDAPTYNGSRDAWQALFAPPAAAVLGGYDFRVTFTNTTTEANSTLTATSLVEVRNNLPTLDGLGAGLAAPATVERMTGLIVWAEGGDTEDSPAALNLSLAYRRNGSADPWDDAWLGAPTSYNATAERWEATLTPAPVAERGLYDLRALLADTDGGASGWLLLSEAFNVTNHPPEVLDLVADAINVTRGANLTLSATVLDENPATLTPEFAYRGAGGWESGWLGAPWFDGVWHANLTPAAAAALDAYDVRVRFTDPEGNTSDWYEVAGLLEILNAPPIVTAITVTDATPYRNTSFTVVLSVADVETATGDLVPALEYRARDNGSWESTWAGAAAFNASSGEWEFAFALPADAATGYYDLRARVDDGDGGLFDWRLLVLAFTALNNLPEVADAEFTALTVYQGRSVTMVVRGHDGDEAAAGLMLAVEQRLAGNDTWLTGWLAAPVWDAKNGSWIVVFTPSLFAAPGTYDFRLRFTDGEGDDGDYYEMLAAVTVLPESQLPELRVAGFVLSAYEIPAGATINILVRVANNGPTAAGPFTIAFRLDGTLVTSATVTLVEAHSFTEVAATWTVAAQPGSHEFRVVVDADLIIVERDETNNEATLTLTVQAPESDGLPGFGGIEFIVSLGVIAFFCRYGLGGRRRDDLG